MGNFGNDNIIIKKAEGIEYIQFKRLLEYGIKHAYTLKGEGINYRSNSKEEKESYQKIFNAVGLDIKTFMKPIQRHTKNVKCVDKIIPKEELNEIDGLITNKENITLVTTNADCILFLFFDPIKRVIANVHSGWRGTLQKISEETIINMIENYGCNPQNIECFIWPSIRKCHFEVEEEVKNLFAKNFEYTKKINEFIEIGEIKEGIQKYLIDTVKINRIILTNLGIKENNIYDCDICSVCNSNRISSYRAEGKEFKLATSIISL